MNDKSHEQLTKTTIINNTDVKNNWQSDAEKHKNYKSLFVCPSLCNFARQMKK